MVVKRNSSIDEVVVKNPRRVKKRLNPIEGAMDSLFVTCANFEERCTHAPRMMFSEYWTQSSVICSTAEYARKGHSFEYSKEIRGHLKIHSKSEPQDVTLDLDHPIRFIRDFESKLIAMARDHSQNVTVDITAFPHEELLMLLNYLDHYPKRRNIRLLYSEPMSYATEEDDEESCWLTRGVRSVRPIPGFCGIQYPQLSKLLVVILGHEGERTQITLRRHQPDKVFLIGQGTKQFHSGLDKIANRENEKMIAQLGREAWKAELPAHGVVETMQTIAQIFYENRYSYNIFIAPNGTKLQAVGTYLAARKLLELQVTYAIPALYNWEKFSTGTGPMWEFTLDPDRET